MRGSPALTRPTSALVAVLRGWRRKACWHGRCSRPVRRGAADCHCCGVGLTGGGLARGDASRLLALVDREVDVRAPVLILIGLMAVSTAPAAEQAPPASGAPETFSAKAEAQRGAGAVSATMQISITRYSSDFDRTNVETGLKHGGYPGFLTALRKASVVGSVAIGDNKFAIRWAREQKPPRDVPSSSSRTSRCSSSAEGRRIQAARRIRSGRHPTPRRRFRSWYRHHGRGRACQTRGRCGRAGRRLRRRGDQAGVGYPEDAVTPIDGGSPPIQPELPDARPRRQ